MLTIELIPFLRKTFHYIPAVCSWSECDFSIASSRENWRFSNSIRCEIGTTKAPRCWVPIWRDHTIGPKTVKSGDNYSTAPKRNMEMSARGNLINMYNHRRASSSYNYYTCCVISPPDARCCSRSCTENNFKMTGFAIFSILPFFRLLASHPPSRSNCTLFCLGVQFVPRHLHTSQTLERFSTFEWKSFSEKNPCHHCSEFWYRSKPLYSLILFYHSKRCRKLITCGPRASSWVWKMYSDFRCIFCWSLLAQVLGTAGPLRHRK